MTALPDTNHLILDLDQGWLTVWLNNPENRNALSEELAGELTATLDAIRDDRSVRGITLRGKGGTFCAGGDLKAFMAGLMGGATREDVAAMNKGGGVLFQKVYTAPQVVVAIVEGAAIGGGLGLACCADIVIAASDAKFSLTETQLGIPPAQIAPHVIRRVGLTTARRLMLTGARFDGSEANAIALADFAADATDMLEAIEHKVRTGVMRCAPGANAATKALLRKATRLESDALMDQAASIFADCLLSDEGREGVSAFVQKRKPEWAVEKQ